MNGGLKPFPGLITTKEEEQLKTLRKEHKSLEAKSMTPAKFEAMPWHQRKSGEAIEFLMSAPLGVAGVLPQPAERGVKQWLRKMLLPGDAEYGLTPEASMEALKQFSYPLEELEQKERTTTYAHETLNIMARQAALGNPLLTVQGMIKVAAPHWAEFSEEQQKWLEQQMHRMTTMPREDLIDYMTNPPPELITPGEMRQFWEKEDPKLVATTVAWSKDENAIISALNEMYGMSQGEKWIISQQKQAGLALIDKWAAGEISYHDIDEAGIDDEEKKRVKSFIEQVSNGDIGGAEKAIAESSNPTEAFANLAERWNKAQSEANTLLAELFPGKSVEELDAWLSADPKNVSEFFNTLYTRGLTAGTETILKRMGMSDDEVVEFYTGHSMDALRELGHDSFEEFRTLIRGLSKDEPYGRTEYTENLLKTLYADIDQEWLDSFFAMTVPEKFVRGLYLPEGFLRDTVQSFTAGIGDLLSVSSGVAAYLDYGDASRTLNIWGVSAQAGMPPSRLGEFNIGDLANPEFYSHSIGRTVPFCLSLVPLALGGWTLGAAGATALGTGRIGTMIIAGFSSAALSRPVESVMEAGGAYNEALSLGMTEKEAHGVFDEVFKKNLILVGADAFEIIVALSPTPKWVPKALVSRGLVRTARIGGKMVIVGLSEGGEEIYQDIRKRHALKQEWALDAQTKEVFAIGFMMGAFGGLAGDVITPLMNKTMKKADLGTQEKFTDTVLELENKGFSHDSAKFEAFNDFVNESEENAVFAQETLNEIVAEAKEPTVKPGAFEFAPASEGVSEWTVKGYTVREAAALPEDMKVGVQKALDVAALSSNMAKDTSIIVGARATVSPKTIAMMLPTEQDAANIVSDIRKATEEAKPEVAAPVEAGILTAEEAAYLNTRFSGADFQAGEALQKGMNRQGFEYPMTRIVFDTILTEMPGRKRTPEAIYEAKLEEKVVKARELLNEENKLNSITRVERALNALSAEEREAVEGLEDVHKAITDYKDITKKGLTPEEYQNEKGAAFEAIEEALTGLKTDVELLEVTPFLDKLVNLFGERTTAMINLMYSRLAQAHGLSTAAAKDEAIETMRTLADSLPDTKPAEKVEQDVITEEIWDELPASVRTKLARTRGIEEVGAKTWEKLAIEEQASISTPADTKTVPPPPVEPSHVTMPPPITALIPIEKVIKRSIPTYVESALYRGTEQSAKEHVSGIRHTKGLYGGLGLPTKDVILDDIPDRSLSLGNLKELEDTRYFMSRLEDATGEHWLFYWDEMCNACGSSVLVTHEYSKLVSQSKFKPILRDNKAKERIANYIISKNPVYSKVYVRAFGGKAFPTPTLSALEKEMADVITGIYKDFEPKIRYMRFMEAYRASPKVEDITKKIIDAVPVDVAKAIEIAKTGDNIAVFNYLADKTWGVIESGYSPIRALAPKIHFETPSRSLFSGALEPGKGVLEMREAIEFSSEERDVIHRTFGYIQRTEAMFQLSPVINEMERVYNRTAKKFKNPYEGAKILTSVFNEARRMPDSPNVVFRGINALYSQIMTTVFLHPALSFRNIFQPFALFYKRKALFTHGLRRMSPAKKAFFDWRVSQMGAVKSEWLFEQTKPAFSYAPGIGRANTALVRFSRKVSLYAYSDQYPRMMTFNTASELAADAVKAWVRNGRQWTPKAINKLRNASGLYELTHTQQKFMLGILNQDRVTLGIPGVETLSGEEAFGYYVGLEVTNNTHFTYERYMRAHIEKGAMGRAFMSLAVFPRSYAQRCYNLAKKLKEGSVTEKRQAFGDLAGLVVMGWLISSTLYAVTGRYKDTYLPWKVFGWTPGGLWVGGAMDFSIAARDTIQAITTGDAQDINKAMRSVQQLTEESVPFYKIFIDIVSTLSDEYPDWDMQKIKEIRAAFDKEYTPEEVEKLNSSTMEKMQRALWGTRATPASEQEGLERLETEVGELTQLYTQIGENDEEGIPYTIARFATDTRRFNGRFPPDLVDEEWGVPEFSLFILDVDKMLDENYYTLPVDARRLVRRNDPGMDALLFMLGHTDNVLTDAAREQVMRVMDIFSLPDNALGATPEQRAGWRRMREYWRRMHALPPGGIVNFNA